MCEVAAALALLRTGGSLLLKLFGFQTPVTKSVLRYLFMSFEQMIALKPISSRPASAERYLVCAGFRGPPEGWTGAAWRDQMFLGTLPNGEVWMDDKKRQRFDQYIDEFECDILALNLKACHMILTNLEVKHHRLSKGFDVPVEFEGSRGSVDIDAYRKFWHLM